MSTTQISPDIPQISPKHPPDNSRELKISTDDMRRHQTVGWVNFRFSSRIFFPAKFFRVLSRKSLWAYCWTLSVTSDPSTLSQLPGEQIYKEKKLCDTGKSAWCIKWACAMVRWPYVIEINTCNGSVYHFWPYSDQIIEKVLGGIFFTGFCKVSNKQNASHRSKLPHSEE